MSTSTRHPSVVFSGGGTGGHVFPGLAVAEELRSLGWRTAWIGRGRSLEERLVAAAGLDFRPLPARAFVDRGALARAIALGVLAGSALRAAVLLRRLGAAVVFATGGYACAPAALGARLNGTGLYLLEPNAQSGAANCSRGSPPRRELPSNPPRSSWRARRDWSGFRCAGPSAWSASHLSRATGRGCWYSAAARARTL